MLFGEFQCKLHVDCYLLLYKTCRILMKFISQNWNLDKLGFRLLIWTECYGVWFKYLDFRFWSGFNNSEITIFVKWQNVFVIFFTYWIYIYILDHTFFDLGLNFWLELSNLLSRSQRRMIYLTTMLPDIQLI